MNKTLQLLLTIVWISAGLFTSPVYSDETILGRVPGTAVMSGSVTPLSSQTAGRLGKELQGRTINKIFNNPKRDWIKGQNINIVKKFSENYKKKENQTTGKKTLLVVTHKNPARINMISEIFENTPISNNIPTLIIDDEADHHSLNSKDPTFFK